MDQRSIHSSSLLAGHHAHTIAPGYCKLPELPGGAPCILSVLGKGGAGKTTTAVQLAGIAEHLGYRVLILDTDPQQSATDWRALDENNAVVVHACRQEEVKGNIEKAREEGFELVVIDNPPVRTPHFAKVACLANLSLVMVRPSTLDLVVGFNWIRWLKGLDCEYAVVISSAPPIRQGVASPLVRDARDALRTEARRVSSGQITLRHIVIDSIGTGCTLMQVDPVGPAAVEYRLLWNGLMKAMETRS